MELEKFISISTALGCENRVKIINLLSAKNLCNCQILEYFHISQPTLSTHMKILLNADLVIEHPNGKWKIYELNKKILDEYISECKRIFTPNAEIYNIKKCENIKKSKK